MIQVISKVFKVCLLLVLVFLMRDAAAQNVTWPLTANANATVTGLTGVTANAQTQGAGISSVKYTTNGASALGYDGSAGSTCAPNDEDSLGFSMAVTAGTKRIYSVEFTHRRVSGTSANCCWQLFVVVGNGAAQSISANISTNGTSATATFDKSNAAAIFPLTVNAGQSVFFSLLGDASNGTDSLAVKNFSVDFCNVTLTPTPTQPQCFGDLGSVALNATGGTAPYTFGGDATSNLAAGTYNYSVTDNFGCPASASTTINSAPTALLISTSSVTQPLCFGQTGTVVLTASGGTGSKQFSKDGGSTFQASSTFSNLAAGTYTFVVKDANNCTTTLNPTITITVPGQLTIDTVSVTKPLCFGQTGTIVLTAGGGTGAKEFSNDGGSTFQSSNTFSNLTAGTYTCVVRDANGCTATFTPAITITVPAQLTINVVSVTQPLCNSQTGIVVLGSSGGTNPKQFSKDGGIIYQASSTFTSMAAGTYTFVVKDANNCTATLSPPITINSAPSTIAASGNVSSNFNGAQISCTNSSDGEITITASGGTPSYLYSINGGPNQSSNVFTNLDSGSYTVVVTDDNGCTFTIVPAITITAPSAISTSASVDSVNCKGGNDGSITLTVSGGTPGTPLYTFLWSNSATTKNISSLTAASYSVTVTDGNGCTKNASFSVLEPLRLEFSSTVITDVLCEGGTTGAIGNTTTGGTPGYTYLWNTGATTEDVSNLIAGSYTVTITDHNFCTFDTTFTVATTNFKSQTPTTISSNKTVICSGDNITLSVNGTLGTNGIFKWYANACGTGGSIGSGTSINQTLTNNTTAPIVKEFFVRAEDPAPCAFNTSCKSISITVNPIPELASVDFVEVCSDEPLGYQILADISSNMTFGWTPFSVASGISDTTSQSLGTNNILNDALHNNSFTIAKNVVYSLELVFTDSGLSCSADTQLTVKVNPKPDLPTFSEQLTPVSNPFSGTSICGGTSAYSLAINTPLSGISYVWNVNSLNAEIGDSLNHETIISFVPQSSDYQVTITVVATNNASVGSCKATSTGLTISVSSGDAIEEKEIVPKEPGHLLVYLDNSSDLRYRWGYDSIEVAGATKKLVGSNLITGQNYQMFVPSAKFIQPANGSDPEQLDTIHYAYWVQVIKVSATDTCYTRVYYNGPYCTTCGNRPTEEFVSDEVKASLWPNPNRGNFTVAVSGDIYGRIEASVVNSLGQIVSRRTLMKDEPLKEYFYPDDEFPPGFYQLQLLGNQGEKVTSKFVILSK